VSLVERQLRLLRERNHELRSRLAQLMDIARDNDRLFERTRRLIVALLDADSLEDLVATVEDSLRHDFQVPFVSLLLFSDNPPAVGRWVSPSARPSSASAPCSAATRRYAACCAPRSWPSCSPPSRSAASARRQSRCSTTRACTACWPSAAPTRSTTRDPGHRVPRPRRRDRRPRAACLVPPLRAVR